MKNQQIIAKKEKKRSKLKNLHQSGIKNISNKNKIY